MSTSSTVSVKDAEKKLTVTSNLVAQYSNEVPETAMNLSRRLEVLKTKLNSGTNPVAIMKECEEIRRALTMARYDRIWRLVEKADLEWRNKPFGEVYYKNGLARDVRGWLDSNPNDLTISQILAKINDGEGMLTQLRSPWGRCKCGDVLTPIMDVIGKFHTYPLCQSCHLKERFALQNKS